jgi:hypothetical protein
MLAVFIVAIGLTATLWALAALHAYWGAGGLWPEKDAVALARKVVGTPGVTKMPGQTACFAVAIALFIAGLWPLDIIGIVPVFASVGLSVLAGYTLAAVFILRGVAAYLPVFRERFPEEPFATNDRRLYGPLCLVIGAGIVFLLTY